MYGSVMYGSVMTGSVMGVCNVMQVFPVWSYVDKIALCHTNVTHTNITQHAPPHATPHTSYSHLYDKHKHPPPPPPTCMICQVSSRASWQHDWCTNMQTALLDAPVDCFDSLS